MFKKLAKILDLHIQVLLKQLEISTKKLSDADSKKQWDLETGEKFNDLVCRYPISEDELLSMSETVCKFVMYTRLTNIDKYLFKDNELTMPKLPMDIR